MRNPWHAFIERFLPWYDPEKERARNERTEAILREARAARNRAAEVRDAYVMAGAAVKREP